MRIITKPHPHQIRGAKRIWNFEGRALVADEMGLGKSYTSLLYAFQNKKARPILIICPANLKMNWDRECRNHFGMSPIVLEGRKVSIHPSMAMGEVYIINYDILGDVGSKKTDDEDEVRKTWIDFFAKIEPQIIIIDEGHYIKNRSAKRTKWVKKVCKDVPNVLVLTGTPITNRPAEIWSILNLLKPKKYPVFFDFAMRYTRPKKTWYGWDFRGARRMPELNEKLKKDVMIRRLKCNVLKDLPPKSEFMVPLPITNRSEYDRAERDFLSWLDSYDPRKANSAARAEHLVKWGYLKRLAARLKLEPAIEWVDNFLEESTDKIILFDIHKFMTFHLRQHFGDQCVVIDGSQSHKQKREAEERFNDDKSIRILIGNIDAAGTGFNFQKSCATTAFLELPWVPALLDQAKARVDRMGQTKPVTSYYLVAGNTIEEYLCEVIQNKIRIINQIIDGTEVLNTMALLDLLAKKIRLNYQKGKY